MRLHLPEKIDLQAGYLNLLNFFFPLRCQQCLCHLPAYPQRHLCDRCHEQLFNEIALVCRICGKPAPRGEYAPYLCGDCRYKSRPSLWFLSAGTYEGMLKSLIHKLKYGQRRYLAELLGSYLCEFLKTQDFDRDRFDFIIPVPLSRVKMRDRGFNQSELVSRPVAEYFDIPIYTDVLRRRHHRHPQATLARKDRLTNLMNVFYTDKHHKRHLQQASVILIDDVRSTGSTMYFCSQQLFAAGVHDILALTVAFNECR